MRRNDIVSRTTEEGFWYPYGRVNRFIDENHVEIIDCYRYVDIVPIDDLEVHNEYKGFWYTKYLPKPEFRKMDPNLGSADECIEVQEFIRMPTLRKLKQNASRSNPEVWKKNRKNQK